MKDWSWVGIFLVYVALVLGLVAMGQIQMAKGVLAAPIVLIALYVFLR